MDTVCSWVATTQLVAQRNSHALKMKTKSWQALTWPDHNLRQTCFKLTTLYNIFTENQGLRPWQIHCYSHYSFDVVEFQLSSLSAFKRMLGRYKNCISVCFNYTLTKQCKYEIYRLEEFCQMWCYITLARSLTFLLPKYIAYLVYLAYLLNYVVRTVLFARCRDAESITKSFNSSCLNCNCLLFVNLAWSWNFTWLNAHYVSNTFTNLMFLTTVCIFMYSLVKL